MTENKNLTVYFLHLRKTAGTSLNKIISASSNAPPILSTDSFRDYLSYSFSNKENSPGNLIVRTHSYYGIHAMNFNHLFNPDKYTYITILRDPIERAISYYFYVRRDRPKKYEHPASKFARQVDIKEFYQYSKRDNEQTRILSGYPSKFFDRCNSWLLERAKSNLMKHFSVVGVTERFDETVALINRKFDWNLDLNVPRAKVNKARPKKEELSKETINYIQNCHQFDTEIYQFARQIFEEQLSH